MSARKYPYTCDNPLCRKSIEPDQPYSIELAQFLPDLGVRGRWHLCNAECVRQYLALCVLKDAARMVAVEP